MCDVTDVDKGLKSGGFSYAFFSCDRDIVNYRRAGCLGVIHFRGGKKYSSRIFVGSLNGVPWLVGWAIHEA